MSSNRDMTSDAELARRRKSFAQKRSLSEYGVSLPDQPEDLTGVHPKDDRYKFFSRGRDYQPRKAKHRFTDEELRTVETFESAAVLPSCSEVYRKWLNKTSLAKDSWIIISLIAVITGTLASVMKLVVEKFQLFYIPFISNMIESDEYLRLWIFYPILGCSFSILSAVTVVYFCPVAAGSGLPEIIGILNGCVVRNVLNFKTLAFKMISCIFTVISTLPVGFEGPMVHIGALVGACMAKPWYCQAPRSKKNDHDDNDPHYTNCFPAFCRYRDCRERHSLICVGAAAGVASAFSSPIAGLTFAMEEMSSHWSKTLTWQTFVCCILARSTAELLHSLFTAVESLEENEYSHLFHLSESALFDMRKMLNFNLAIFVPAAFMGIVGGLLGSVFVFFLLKLAKFRRRLLACVQHPQWANVLKILEVIIVSLLSSAVVLLSMQFATCKPVAHSQVLHDGGAQSSKHVRLRSFMCDQSLNVSQHDDELLQTGQFNEGASLLFGSWEQMIRNLFSRRTAGYFDLPILAYTFAFFLVFSSWASITSIASGLLIPQLAIGALYGRAMGQFMHDILNISSESTDWDWLDPGALAILGAASFLSGTSRLPVTSVIMMVEMTNDVNISVLIMLCVMLSKFCGDLFTHSLYHSMLDFKCIPYLESELKIYYNGARLNLEVFRAEDVMKSPVQYVGVKENVYTLANLLLDTNHGGFPVVQVGNGQFYRTFLGVITRLELTILLTKTKSFDARELAGEDIDRIRISYPEYSSGKLKDLETVNEILHNYSSSLKYRSVYVNLLPYINTSATSVPNDYSLYRAYMMFRFLGLRHMVVVDRHNQVEGIITRKDLMGFTVEKKLKYVRNNNFRRGFYIGSPSSTSEGASSGASPTPSSGSPTTIYEVISRADSMTPQGLQATVIPEEAEEDEEVST